MALRGRERGKRRTNRRRSLEYEVISTGIDGVLHGINNRLESVGQIVGADGAVRGVHVDASGLRLLGTLGGSASVARDINNIGAIVGGALTLDDVAHHAFLVEDGMMHDLNDLVPPDSGWELVQALGINDTGDVIAIGHRNGLDQVVLLRRRRTK